MQKRHLVEEHEILKDNLLKLKELFIKTENEKYQKRVDLGTTMNQSLVDAYKSKIDQMIEEKKADIDQQKGMIYWLS